MRRAILAVLSGAIVAFGTAPACGAEQASGRLVVAGSGGLRAPMEDAAALFAKKRGVAVQVTDGPLDTWANRVRFGEVDVVFAGAEYQMDEFQEKELLVQPATRATLAYRVPGILLRPRNPKDFRTFTDVTKPGVRILVVSGDGQAGLWEEVAARAGGLVPEFRQNIAAWGFTDADAITKWKTDASLDVFLTWETWHPMLDGAADLVRLPRDIQVVRSAGIAVARGSKFEALAKEFIAFLDTPEARSVFRRWNWTYPLR
jgi:accessory colonization factor AcfC